MNNHISFSFALFFVVLWPTYLVNCDTPKNQSLSIQLDKFRTSIQNENYLDDNQIQLANNLLKLLVGTQKNLSTVSKITPLALTNFQKVINIVETFSYLDILNEETSSTLVKCVDLLLKIGFGRMNLYKPIVSYQVFTNLIQSLRRIIKNTEYSTKSVFICDERPTLLCASLISPNLALSFVSNMNKADLIYGMSWFIDEPLYCKSELTCLTNWYNGYDEYITFANKSFFQNYYNFKFGFYVQYPMLNRNNLYMITANEQLLIDLLANYREKLFGNLFSVFIDDQNFTNFTVEIFFNRTLFLDRNRCGFWDEVNKQWSDTCSSELISNDIIHCSCNRTGTYGILGFNYDIPEALIVVCTLFAGISVVMLIVFVTVMSLKLRRLRRNGSSAIQKPAESMLVSSIVTSVSLIVTIITFAIHVHIKISTYDAGLGFLLTFVHISFLFYFFSLLINNLLLYFTINLKLLYIGYYCRFYAVALCISIVIPIIVYFIQSFSPTKTYLVMNLLLWYTESTFIGSVLVPVLILTTCNLVIIILIIVSKLRQRHNSRSFSTLASTRVDIITIATSFLFSGLTWILLPIYVVGNYVPEYADTPLNDGFFAFLVILNALQGVFLCFHYFVTLQFLIEKKKFDLRSIFIKLFLKKKAN